MNIPYSPGQNNRRDFRPTCPWCHTRRCRSHGKYTRKYFHGPCAPAPLLAVPRFRCLNRECPHSTFSVLPPMVVRYSRFFWPCLQWIYNQLCAGVTPYRLGKNWRVSRGVIVRTRRLLVKMAHWIQTLFREVYDGTGQDVSLERKVKFLTGTLGRNELMHRWFRYRVGERFRVVTPGTTHNDSMLSSS